MMGKRSDFERNPRDFYPTPYKAVLPLLPHLPKNARFAEPCCGDMALVNHLERHGHNCYWASDIEKVAPETPRTADALTLTNPLSWSDYVITNPPWRRDILHSMIEHFRKLSPTWLLFDADWMHTKQAAPYLPYCQKIVSVGRVSWMDNGVSGKDNCCWYLFREISAPTFFTGRQK